MLNNGSLIGEVLETLGDTGVQIVKQVVQAPVDLTKTAGSQAQAAAGLVPGSDLRAHLAETGQQQQNNQQSSQDFVKDLYGKSQSDSANPDPNALKAMEDKKQEDIRKKLLLEQHNKTYFQALNNPPKPAEPRQAEKVELEKKQEMQDLQQTEEKKPQPLAVLQASHKAEQFRGAAG